MAEFFHMGGYAFYVWSSYGIAAVVLALNFLGPLRQRRRIIGTLRHARARREKLARRRS